MSLTEESTNPAQPMVDTFLTDFFVSSIKRANEIDANYAVLWKQLHTLQSAGGKRLRPTLLFMAYDAFGGENSELIIPVAAAQELLHFSMLIHDDIIDRDMTRYGVANITGSYDAIYAPFVTNKADRIHYANSAAIMAGDLMIAGAHTLITDSNVSSDQKIDALRILYESMFGVAGGELLDTESSFRTTGSVDPLKIAHYKTASYSFVGPLLTGAVLAGADDNTQENLRSFAINLGIAYQLSDDLLGVFGDEIKTGKSNTGDIREGKQTYLIAQTVSNLTGDNVKIFKKYFGNKNATTDNIATIKKLITESGARLNTENLMQSYVDEATHALLRMNLPDMHKEKFVQLINKATRRER